MKAAGFGPQIKNYVFCRRPQESTVPTFEFVNEPVKTFAQRLRAQPGKHIWMMGGGEIIASFLNQGEIDEFRITSTFLWERSESFGVFEIQNADDEQPGFGRLPAEIGRSGRDCRAAILGGYGGGGEDRRPTTGAQSDKANQRSNVHREFGRWYLSTLYTAAECRGYRKKSAVAASLW